MNGNCLQRFSSIFWQANGKIVCWVESMRSIISCTSLLEPDVRFSVHPAPDVLGFPLAHVYVIMAAFMYSSEVIGFPVAVIAVNVVQVNRFS